MTQLSQAQATEVARIVWSRRFANPITTLGVEMYLPENYRLAATIDGSDTLSRGALAKAIKRLATDQ